MDGLRIAVREGDGGRRDIVSDVGFSIAEGEVLALIGESGSGKTTIALALLGWTRPGCRIVGGSVRLGQTEVLSLPEQALRRLRGKRVAYVAQSAAAAFNPSKTIIDQVVEAALVHGTANRRQAEERAVELFRKLALPEPEHIGRRYPHQVSGGQLQRLMAAMALIADPELVVFDEPTTALDVTTQVDVLRAFKNVIAERGTTAVYVSHDLAVVAQIADEILVLRSGSVRETGRTSQILRAPEDDYTRVLLGAFGGDLHPEPAAARNDVLLEMRAVAAGYGRLDALGQPKNLVLNDIDVVIGRARTIGVIGESGSGKSTIARVMAGLLAPASGRLTLDGEALPATLGERSREQLRRIQIVFQNADTALNPAQTVAQVLGRPIEFYHEKTGAEKLVQVRELLDMIRLPRTVLERKCGELSGGQKQRINLARALAAKPDLILCDEVTSALDTVVAAAILDLLIELQKELELSYLFVSHDISVVRSLCDDVVVLYAGRVVEAGTRSSFSMEPHHPYTRRLLSSVPSLEQGWLERIEPVSTNAVPTKADDKTLCPFLERCPDRLDGVCNTRPPPNITLADGKSVRCHRFVQTR